MIRRPEHGFSMMELMVVVMITGIMLAFTLPSFMSFTKGNNLRTAGRQIARQLLEARDRAISSGSTQTIRFMKDFNNSSDYHIWNGSVASPSWRLPQSINYYWGSGTVNTYRMTSDGRCMDTGYIILQNDRGDRDTVSVRLSGLVLVY